MLRSDWVLGKTTSSARKKILAIIEAHGHPWTPGDLVYIMKMEGPADSSIDIMPNGSIIVLDKGNPTPPGWEVINLDI